MQRNATHKDALILKQQHSQKTLLKRKIDRA